MLKKGISTPPSYRDTPQTPRGSHWLRNSLVLVSLALFAGAGALAVVKPPETPAIYEAKQTLALPSPFPEPLGNVSGPYVSETHIRRGDTLAALLQRLRVKEKDLQQFLTHDKEARSIYKLYPGRSIQVGLDADGQLVWLRYNHTPSASDNGRYVSKWLEVRPDGSGSYAASEHSAVAETHVRVAEGEIESSLFGATDAADVPDAVTLQMTEILGSKIDFMQDLRRGDRFRIIYESYTHEGRDIGAGRILALEFNNKDKSHEAVWFSPEQGKGSYYDFSGASLKGAFLRTALKFTRISSNFGMRKHPVHGGWRGHKGVDYAAAPGTPIHATADGVVEFIGKQGGYGNVVILKHHGDYSTLYGHQHGFAKGLKKGDSVEQGQLIGYVGSTGWATGPHLHYEFRVGKKPIDPLSVDLPVARALEGKERQAFENTVTQYREHIRLLTRLQDQDVSLASR